MYQSRRAAATHRLGVELHGRCGHAGGGQDAGDGLCAGQAELERGGLRVGVGIGRIAEAGDRDQRIAAFAGQCVQRCGG